MRVSHQHVGTRIRDKRNYYCPEGLAKKGIWRHVTCATQAARSDRQSAYASLLGSMVQRQC